jgi:hypothetical protein
MKDVRHNARIEAFKIARSDSNPEECDFIDRFTKKMNWQYFNLDEADAATKQSVISLPFEKDFKNLQKG